ncbi:MAG: hypothetical protein BWY69_00613 [Planctomycetes bacterium ADurb.Bin401]|nr:MAG: hypothetical protein BWY69_00613 [Planctomycetes bacterium ADurb.Bin401]
MNEITMEQIIADALIEQDEIISTQTFEAAGVLTTNNGLVVRTEDGSEFQITIIQSK